MENIIRRDVEILWDYMKLGMPVTHGDCIVGFGCINDDIATHCSRLYLEGRAGKILFSGGLGRNTLGRWGKSEAEGFAEIAMAMGVPAEDIILENKSANSAENILFTREILRENGLEGARLICVHKPFMERRLMSAMGVYWPGVNAVFTSPPMSIDEYILSCGRQGLTEKAAIEILVGDFQRMEVYAEKGYQLPQEIPPEACEAFERLVAAGYTGELVK